MDALTRIISELTGQLGIKTCQEFDARKLIPQQRVRDFCAENKCGNYGSNYMCPPYVGSLEDIEACLKQFKRGILLQYSESMNVGDDREGVERTKVKFHSKILQVEDFFNYEMEGPRWGMIGGSCSLCPICKAKFDEPCQYPDKARTSLESVGIDVIAFLDQFGLDNKFLPDRITWTGCILY